MKWYEKEKTGLGEEFLDSFEVLISRIERNPLHASSYDATSRRATLNRFPYEVIYLVNDLESEIDIIAISHQHRKPEKEDNTFCHRGSSSIFRRDHIP